MTALLLVPAVGFLGPIVARLGAKVLGPPLAGLAPVGGFLASANLAHRHAALLVGQHAAGALGRHELHAAVQQHHHRPCRHPGAAGGPGGELAITSSGPGLPAAALADVRATAGVRSAVALTPTTLGPSLGVSDDVMPAQILDGGQGGGLDAGVTAGSLAALRGDAIALGRHRADAAHAKVGDRVAVTLGDGTRTRATVVAIYIRALGFGDALLARSSQPATGQPAARDDPRRTGARPPSPGACVHWLRAIPGCG